MTNSNRVEHASETWLTDATVFEVNRTPAHSNHKCFTHDPQSGEYSDLTQSLDGEWRVEIVQASDIDFNEEPFAAENFDDSAFFRVQVPGHLQMAGLLKNKYVNTQYPWDGHENPLEPNVPENNHVALYRRKFVVSKRLADTKESGGSVSIVFHGMATAIYVWVNGLFAGYGEDGFTPNEFDITDLLHDGENVVAVACYEYSSASWLEDQDFWRLHGLFRSVELTAQPHVHVENMQLEADWDAESGTASLDAALSVRNASDAATISATLKDSEGNLVWETSTNADTNTTFASGSLQGLEPWSAENPSLYELEVNVIDQAGNIVEAVVQKVGFRRFRIENGIMTLNGKRVVFKGADRHEFDAKRGRSITEQDMIDDVIFCKRHNINAIRTSHYPNQERWYDLCDEYGIYLIDETNLETHGSWCLPGDVVTAETAAATIRMISIGSFSCSMNRCKSVGLGASFKRLGPYFCRRSAAWAPLRPCAVTSSCCRSSPADWVYSCFIGSRSFPKSFPCDKKGPCTGPLCMSLILEQAVRAAKPGMTNTPRTSKVWNYSPMVILIIGGQQQLVKHNQLGVTRFFPP